MKKYPTIKDPGVVVKLKINEYKALRASAYQHGAFGSYYNPTYQFEIEAYEAGVRDSKTARIFVDGE